MAIEDKDKGKNPYDAYSSTAIDKHTEDYAKVFLGLDIIKLNQENCVIKQEQEVRLDHIYKVMMNGKELCKNKFLFFVILFLENKSIPNPSFDKGREQRDFLLVLPFIKGELEGI